MIKDFEKLLKQLDELAKVVNSFKSESVQLKLIDLIFQTEKGTDDIEKDIPETSVELKTKKTKSRRKKKSELTNGNPTKRQTATKGRPGPVKTLEQLIEDKYFINKRSIGEIVQYCNDQLAVTLKSTDLSGTLMKMVRDKKLKRSKNPETNQYEYIINRPSSN